MLANKGELQQIIELVTYFMFMFTTLSANVIGKKSHYSQITTPLESFFYILIIFALIGYWFDVLFVLLCDKGDILYHKNKQLQQIIRLGLIYLTVSLIQQQNIIAKRAYYDTFGTTFQLLIYNSRLLEWMLVFVFSRQFVTVLSKIGTHINYSYIISCAWNAKSDAICCLQFKEIAIFWIHSNVSMSMISTMIAVSNIKYNNHCIPTAILVTRLNV